MDVSHFVCTHQEAEELIRAQTEFWLSDCGCRAPAKDKCRSRTDLCLGFVKEPVSGGGNLRPAKLADALEVLAEAGRHHLVTRPFTDRATTPPWPGPALPGALSRSRTRLPVTVAASASRSATSGPGVRKAPSSTPPAAPAAVSASRFARRGRQPWEKREADGTPGRVVGGHG